MTDLAYMFNTADPTNPGHYGPSQTALLLLDFHSLFVEKIAGPKSPSALVAAAQLRTWAKSQGIVVVHGLVDIHGTPYSTCKGIERLESILTLIQSGGGEEPVELLEAVDENDVTFVRTPGVISALKSPGLEDFLQEKSIKSLVLCGLSTSGCVLRTAIPATDAEYVVTVISDACADPGEGVHDFVIEKILPTRAYLATAAEFQTGYEKVAVGK